MARDLTPECIGSQTVGPYYSIGFDYLVSDRAVGHASPGTHITIHGTLFDGDGVPVPDAILEIWQADPAGQFSGTVQLPKDLGPHGFAGFARLSTHQDGQFTLHTVKPGPVTYPDGTQHAPHLLVLVMMRGLLLHLVTRIYFAGEPANAADPVLLSVPEARRSTLIAANTGDNANAFRWDIHMQGPAETVFFNC